MFGLHYLTQSWPQSILIPAPTLTGTELPDQTGRVHLVTGGYGGVGEHLAHALYARHAVVYIAGRSPHKAAAAKSRALAAHPASRGRLEFLHLDLADLATVRPAVDAFRARETRLHVLVNNAGVMCPPSDSDGDDGGRPPTSPQGHELHLATNCLGHFLLARLLMPVLRATAREEAASQTGRLQAPVRVLWAASLSVNWFSPRNGVAMEETSAGLRPKAFRLSVTNYGQSKAGNYFYATEFHRRHGHCPDSDDGDGGDGSILSIAFNPGNLQTDLQRSFPTFLRLLLPIGGYPARYGAYTALFSGWSPDLTMDHGGSYTIPWGRLGNQYLRYDVLSAAQDSDTNPNSPARQFWDWSEQQTDKYI